jgi:hypothetical protein
VIRVTQTTLGSALRADFQNDNSALFPDLQLQGNESAADTPVISAVWLPDGRSYRFEYNRFLEVARVTLPAGGAVEYDYGPGVSNGYTSGQIGKAHGVDPQVSAIVPYRLHLYRRVKERRVYGDGANLEARTLYGRPETLPAGWQGASGPADTGFVTTTGPVTEETYWVRSGQGETKLESVRRSYYSYPYEQGTPSGAGSPAHELSVDRITAHHSPFEGKEFLTEHSDAAGTTVLGKRERTWTLTGEPRGVNLTAEANSLRQQAGTYQTARVAYAYDQYNNETSRVEYDFDSSEARTTTTEYYTNATTDAEFLAAYLRGLRKSVTVTRSGAQEAKVLYSYDGSAVEPAGTSVNLEAVSGKRGNLTREERWLSGAPQNPAAVRVYYSTGQVKQETNARGKTTVRVL